MSLDTQCNKNPHVQCCPLAAFTGSKCVWNRLDMSSKQNVMVSAAQSSSQITIHMRNQVQVPPLAAAASGLQCAVCHPPVSLATAPETYTTRFAEWARLADDWLKPVSQTGYTDIHAQPRKGVHTLPANVPEHMVVITTP